MRLKNYDYVAIFTFLLAPCRAGPLLRFPRNLVYPLANNTARPTTVAVPSPKATVCVELDMHLPKGISTTTLCLSSMVTPAVQSRTSSEVSSSRTKSKEVGEVPAIGDGSGNPPLSLLTTAVASPIRPTSSNISVIVKPTFPLSSKSFNMTSSPDYSVGSSATPCLAPSSMASPKASEEPVPGQSLTSDSLSIPQEQTSIFPSLASMISSILETMAPSGTGAFVTPILPIQSANVTTISIVETLKTTVTVYPQGSIILPPLLSLPTNTETSSIPSLASTTTLPTSPPSPPPRVPVPLQTSSSAGVTLKKSTTHAPKVHSTSPCSLLSCPLPTPEPHDSGEISIIPMTLPTPSLRPSSISIIPVSLTTMDLGSGRSTVIQMTKQDQKMTRKISSIPTTLYTR